MTSAFHRVPLDDLARVVKAAQENQTARTVLLTTHDPDAALKVVSMVAQQFGVSAHTMSMASRRLARSGSGAFEQVAGAAADPVDVFRAAGDANGPAVVLFQDMLRFVHDTTGDPRARAFFGQLVGADNRKPHVYAFCEPPEGDANVPSFARSLVGRVNIPLPSGAELLILAKEELTTASTRSGKVLDRHALGEWAGRLAAHLPGLPNSAARFAIQDAVAGHFDLERAVETLAVRKAAQLQSQLAMEILRPAAEPPVGMENFYRWLRIHRERMCVAGPNRVKGAVLVGPPGTGKTRLGAYAARVLGVTGIWFRFGALLGMYVGQSEANAERAFAVLDALGTSADSGHERGVVVLLDELEKTIGHGDNDGGVTRRVVSRTLTWMSESTAPNMILATANDLECMGELADIITRPGRLNKIFFVDVPGMNGRRELLQRLIASVDPNVSVDIDRLAAATERFSGADIEGSVQDAIAEARADQGPLDQAQLERQFDQNRIQVLARYERFNRLREWARANAAPAGDPDR
jgi:hypothetical protein